MSAALGHWPNAPLAYVLAQVCFEPFLEIEKYLPTLQTRLRERYPRFQQIEGSGWGVLTDEPRPPRLQPAGQVSWELATAANDEGVIVQQDSLVLHVTAYHTHDRFNAAWRWVMERVGEQIPHLLVNRIGLRYVNFILPDAGETPEDYVVDRLRCDPGPGIPYQRHRGLTLAEYGLESGILTVRYLRGMGQPTLPADLGRLGLQPSAIMAQPVAEAQATAVLDIDRFMPLSATYAAGTLAEQFHQMHQDTSAAFKALTTAHGQGVWQQERR